MKEFKDYWSLSKKEKYFKYLEQQRFINYRRTAYKKVRYHVSHVMGYRLSGLKINKVILLFANHYNLKFTYPLRDWIVELYRSGENDIIKRNQDSFYGSTEWRKLRLEVILLYGTVCMKCGSDDGDHVVDHIKPRSKFPLLELDISNMQVLCNTCNLIKSDRNCFDYRPYQRTGLKNPQLIP